MKQKNQLLSNKNIKRYVKMGRLCIGISNVNEIIEICVMEPVDVKTYWLFLIYFRQASYELKEFLKSRKPKCALRREEFITS